MQRGRIKTVTEFVPILVPAKAGEQGLPATFAMSGPMPYLVRVFGDSELRSAIPQMPADEKAHFLAVVELTKAIETGDNSLMKRAASQIQKALDLRKNLRGKNADGAAIDNIELFRSLAQTLGLSTGQELQAKAVWDGVALSPMELRDARYLLSRQLSRELAGVQLVMWWTGNRFTPALHCPYAASAPYVRALFKGSLAICPHCGVPFTPARRDQQYCSLAHRETHRVARWRAGKKTSGGKRKPPRR